MKEFRLALGLTQADMAKLIGVSQSMIARCESKKRELATPAHLRYLTLYKAWLDHHKQQKPSKDFSAELIKQNGQIRELLSKRIGDLEFQIKRLNRLLQQQRNRFEALQKLSSMLEIWQQATDYGGAQIWIDYLAHTSISELKHCSPSQQQLVLLQIRNAKSLLLYTQKIMKTLSQTSSY